MTHDTKVAPAYKVERNIPLPKPCLRENPIRSTLLGMDVNDSVLIPTKKVGEAFRQARELGFKVASRRVAGGTRIWRTK